MKNEDQIKKLTKKVRGVMNSYRERYPELSMSKDYLPLKITEEWGECMQAYLMLTSQGRQKDKTKEEIRELFSEEITDVFAYILALADQEKIDLNEALEKKWFQYLKK